MINLEGQESVLMCLLIVPNDHFSDYILFVCVVVENMRRALETKFRYPASLKVFIHLISRRYPWYSGSVLNCWPTAGREIDPALRARFITEFI